jgi:phosphoribosylformylglycinamidine (FGAM) synthase-like amidotransferase family enzyme
VVKEMKKKKNPTGSRQKIAGLREEAGRKPFVG